MKNILILLALITLSCCLHTSSFWTKKGINVKDGIYDKIYNVSLNIPTSCSTVNLNVEKYYYNGVVRSGYLNVGKGGSALAFTFYGR
jgi:hypothetical protein